MLPPPYFTLSVVFFVWQVYILCNTAWLWPVHNFKDTQMNSVTGLLSRTLSIFKIQLLVFQLLHQYYYIIICYILVNINIMSTLGLCSGLWMTLVIHQLPYTIQNLASHLQSLMWWTVAYTILLVYWGPEVSQQFQMVIRFSVITDSDIINHSSTTVEE